ncbi:MAG: hypothetical protein JO182_00460 [Acidobacteriaceae bacterium]|nr:hypothetical protein [Acidobacteriaceae bacterium]
MVRDGGMPHGRQRFRCRECGRRSTAHPRPQGYSEEQRTLLRRACQERSVCAV